MLTPPAVKKLIDMETPNSLQEFQMCVSSGVDKSAYSATKNSHCVGSRIEFLRGVLQIFPAVSTWDRSAKRQGKSHSRVWAVLSQHL